MRSKSFNKLCYNFALMSKMFTSGKTPSRLDDVAWKRRAKFRTTNCVRWRSCWLGSRHWNCTATVRRRTHWTAPGITRNLSRAEIRPDLTRRTSIRNVCWLYDFRFYVHLPNHRFENVKLASVVDFDNFIFNFIFSRVYDVNWHNRTLFFQVNYNL